MTAATTQGAVMSGSALAKAEAPLAIIDTGGPLRPADVIAQVALIQEVMGAIMKDGEHYGKIPGCGNKPALLQPGAQVLAFTFRYAPSFDIEVKDLPNLHREYLVRCTLSSIVTGQVIGMGVGSCSTMESKYRYRNVADFEITGEEIPQDSKERKAEYRRQGFGMKKVDGVWEWVRFTDTAKTENPDIADTYNTVLKMASKRAFVHATLNATAASDMFTQDIEDLPALVFADPAPSAPADAPAPPAAPTRTVCSKDTLQKLTNVRGKLGTADSLFAAQIEAISHHEAVCDVELTEPEALELIKRYTAKIAEAEAEAQSAAATAAGLDEQYANATAGETIPF